MRMSQRIVTDYHEREQGKWEEKGEAKKGLITGLTRKVSNGIEDGINSFITILDGDIILMK